MNPLIRNFSMAAALCGFILLPGCSRSPEEHAEDTADALNKVANDAAASTADNALEWQKDKNEILDDLRNIRSKIEHDLGVCNEELAKKDLSAGERERQLALKTELQREQAVVEAAIQSVDRINASTPQQERNEVWTSARTTADEMRTWWQKRVEEQDKHTEADYDQDGH